MAKEVRYYESGPRQGQEIQEYPKMLYKGLIGINEETRIVADEEEHAEARKDGWTTREELAEPTHEEPAIEGEPDIGKKKRGFLR